MDTEMIFDKKLIEKVPESAKNKACICKDCLLRYNAVQFKSV